MGVRVPVQPQSLVCSDPASNNPFAAESTRVDCPFDVPTVLVGGDEEDLAALSGVMGEACLRWFGEPAHVRGQSITAAAAEVLRVTPADARVVLVLTSAVDMSASAWWRHGSVGDYARRALERFDGVALEYTADDATWTMLEHGRPALRLAPFPPEHDRRGVDEPAALLLNADALKKLADADGRRTDGAGPLVAALGARRLAMANPPLLVRKLPDPESGVLAGCSELASTAAMRSTWCAEGSTEAALDCVPSAYLPPEPESATCSSRGASCPIDVPTFVISFKGSTRRNAFARATEALCSAAEADAVIRYVDAVVGTKEAIVSQSQITREQLEDAEDALHHRASFMSLHETAATLSHLKAVRTALRHLKTTGGDVALVLEDDADLSLASAWPVETIRAWLAIAKLPSDWMQVKLGLSADDAPPTPWGNDQVGPLWNELIADAADSATPGAVKVDPMKHYVGQLAGLKVPKLWGIFGTLYSKAGLEAIIDRFAPKNGGSKFKVDSLERTLVADWALPATLEAAAFVAVPPLILHPGGLNRTTMSDRKLEADAMEKYLANSRQSALVAADRLWCGGGGAIQEVVHAHRISRRAAEPAPRRSLARRADGPDGPSGASGCLGDDDPGRRRRNGPRDTRSRREDEDGPSGASGGCGGGGETCDDVDLDCTSEHLTCESIFLDNPGCDDFGPGGRYATELQEGQLPCEISITIDLQYGKSGQDRTSAIITPYFDEEQITALLASGEAELVCDADDGYQHYALGSSKSTMVIVAGGHGHGKKGKHSKKGKRSTIRGLFCQLQSPSGTTYVDISVLDMTKVESGDRLGGLMVTRVQYCVAPTSRPTALIFEFEAGVAITTSGPVTATVETADSENLDEADYVVCNHDTGHVQIEDLLPEEDFLIPRQAGSDEIVCSLYRVVEKTKKTKKGASSSSSSSYRRYDSSQLVQTITIMITPTIEPGDIFGSLKVVDVQVGVGACRPKAGHWCAAEDGCPSDFILASDESLFTSTSCVRVPVVDEECVSTTTGCADLSVGKGGKCDDYDGLRRDLYRSGTVNTNCLPKPSTWIDAEANGCPSSYPQLSASGQCSSV